MQTVAHRATPAMSARRLVARTGHRTAPLRPARRTVVVQAGLRDVADWLATGFLKIFTPPSDSGVNWTGTSAGYPGDINRSHARKYPPMQQAKKDSVGSDQALAMDMKEEEATGADTTPEVAEYIAGALQRVMGHNFVGDETEPDWNGTATGWTGDIRKRRDRDGDGFHSKKL